MGGGVYNSNGLTILENVTVTGNTAPEGRGAGVASIGFDGPKMVVGSSIIVANEGPDPNPSTGTDVDFVSGDTNSFVSEGYNVIGDGNATGAFNGPGDRTGVDDPGLRPLADNGGPTKTHALRLDSPAVDRVAAASCSPPAEDQRGRDRPRDGDGDGTARCDSGAFSKAPPSPPPPPPDRPACNDGRDNDSDGRVDLRDPGCSSRRDDSERNRLKPDPDPTPRLHYQGHQRRRQPVWHRAPGRYLRQRWRRHRDGPRRQRRGARRIGQRLHPRRRRRRRTLWEPWPGFAGGRRWPGSSGGRTRKRRHGPVKQ